MKTNTSSTSNSGSTGDLDLLVAHADPIASSTLETPRISEGLDRLGRRVLASPKGRQSRPYRRRSAVALGFASILLICSVAVGSMYTTHTGIFPKAGTDNDSSELLRIDAPDFQPTVRSLVSEIPFPPGDSAVARIPSYLHQLHNQEGTTMVQITGIKGQFSLQAVCAWRGYWLQEHALGHSANEQLAADGLGKVASSDSMKAVDSWWPVYLAAAHSEAADSRVSARFAGFYRANCADQPRPWAAK
jgi:hypothetical protein